MAVELVSGAFLSSFLNVVFDRLSKPEVVNWIRGRKLDQKLLEKLKTTLYAVRAVLNDAEQKQITDPEVKNWLAKLQHAVYVADDLLDEVSTKAATQKDLGTFLSQPFNSEDMEMVTRIENIIDTLESIVKLKDVLGLENIPMENMSWRDPSTSLVESSDIYGRDKDKEAMIELLLDDTCDVKIPIISIVGIGGIGKTTLAQLVYNDDKLKQKFDFKVWICVSKQFDVFKITKTIIEAITSSTCDKTDLNLLQIDLKEKLTGKTFLIVLDDVWNERLDKWNNLLRPFQHGNKGSKILLTTRNEKVASVMPTIPPCRLSLLSDEDCWSVFLKHSFLSIECKQHATLELTGREIVKKCKGLPLAAETLGSLLRTKRDVKDWNGILKSEIWEFSEDDSRIIPALRISYYYLPSHLKRCFVYCSLYPKDYRFHKDELISLWMAEDLLQLKRRNTLEEIGCVYFNELVGRSFFQPSSTNDSVFVMHDLMHDLATFYAGEFYFRAKELEYAAEIGKVDIKTRHLSHNAKGNYPISKLLADCDMAKHIRTFLEINLNPRDPSKMENALCTLLSQLKYLRVLSFKGCPLDHDSLPDSIGELIHLRYLDLSNTPIMTLPESLNKLYNLQTLKLSNCERLKMLPSSMQNLVNLRHLDIRGTNLKEMPKGMNKLKDLQFLSCYFVGKHEESRIRDFGALASLRGSLNIYNLENVTNSFEASEAKMFCKEHIKVLKLRWSSDKGEVNSQIERHILDKLQPYIDLKELSIEGYRGTIFPDWFGHSSYHNMTNLELKGCSNCCMLPSLGQLPSLKILRLQNFDRLKIIGAEFYKNDGSQGVTPFPSLKTLAFIEMSCWQEWQSFEVDAFPQLEGLCIWECPILIGYLPDHLPELKTLIINECNQLACSLPRAPAILKLKIYGKQEVRIQEQLLSLLRSLSIEGCQLVESMFEAMARSQPTCLKILSISNCSLAISFPGACLPASLQVLFIENCKNLEFPMQQHQQQQQQQHESLQSLVIHNSCDSLTSFPLSAFPNLILFEIASCENIKSLGVSQSRSQDAALPSLRYLTIEECPSFVSLLSQSRNAAIPSLYYLRISSCPNFVSFSMLGLAAPHLEELRIESCSEIDSLAQGDEGLLPNLRRLRIIKCEKLVRCLASSTLFHSPDLLDLGIKVACDSVKSFPREGCLPASLQTLDLHEFPSLEMLDCKGLVHLTSLRRLSIGDCPKLENMAGERLPDSLMELFINQCPLLGERIQMKDLQIWPKVSNICKIIVNKRQIS